MTLPPWTGAAASLPVAALEEPATVRRALDACARPWPANRPPPPPSGASAPCSTTPSATRSSWGCWARTRSTGSSGRPPPSPRPSTAASSPVPPRPGAPAPPGGGAPGRAPEGVLRLPVLRRAAPLRSGHAARDRPAPALTRVGPDRPCCLGRPGRAGLDRRGHRPPGPRPEAPRPQRDPRHPHPPGPGPAAPRAPREVRHGPDGRIFQTARGGLLQDTAYSAVWDQARKTALTPAQHPHPSAAAPTTCGTPPCPWG